MSFTQYNCMEFFRFDENISHRNFMKMSTWKLVIILSVSCSQLKQKEIYFLCHCWLCSLSSMKRIIYKTTVSNVSRTRINFARSMKIENQFESYCGLFKVVENWDAFKFTILCQRICFHSFFRAFFSRN